VHVVSIHTYPIKGCHRVDHERAEVEPWGLAGDRRWLIVDAVTGRALTQRDEPSLTRFHPRASVDSGLIVRTPGMADLVVAQPSDRDLVEVTVWSFTGAATRAGAGADDWFSVMLDRKVRLVWLDDPTRRAVDPAYSRPGDTVNFADGYPVLLASLTSLDALNDLIAEGGSGEGPLPVTRFRPNIVIAGAPAWAEDAWVGRRVRIGEVTFRVPKPCDRCVVTTTDQETGERGHEPLRTLARHRNVDQDLLFAINLIPDNRGIVAAGDPIDVVD